MAAKYFPNEDPAQVNALTEILPRMRIGVVKDRLLKANHNSLGSSQVGEAIIIFQSAYSISGFQRSPAPGNQPGICANISGHHQSSFSLEDESVKCKKGEENIEDEMGFPRQVLSMPPHEQGM